MPIYINVGIILQTTSIDLREHSTDDAGRKSCEKHKDLPEEMYVVMMIDVVREVCRDHSV